MGLVALGVLILNQPRDRDRVLNELSRDINERYGFIDDSPSVNNGPCGRLVNTFRECWLELHHEELPLAFVMSPQFKRCYHVLVKLPGHSYFDGGYGEVSETHVMDRYPDGDIVLMEVFDLEMLDFLSYGLDRSYADCPGYDDETVRNLMLHHLSMIDPSAK